MKNHEETKKVGSSGWMVTLERVEELRQLLLEVQSGEILFWLDGQWYHRNGRNNFPNDFPPPHLILTKDYIGWVNEKNVENIIFNILRLLDYNQLYLYNYSDISFEDYLITKENSDIPAILNASIHESSYFSYDFRVSDDTHKFSYIFEWNESGNGIRIHLNNSKNGYTDIFDLTMFLLENSHTITNYELYTQFCKKMRNFQSYYYKTTSDTDGELYTSQIEIELLNTEFRTLYFNPNVNTYSVNWDVKIADLIDYFNFDIEVTDKKLLEKCIDTDDLYLQFGNYELLNNITVSDVKAVILSTLKPLNDNIDFDIDYLMSIKIDI
ncbi:hypothetical protein [Oceanobacillus sp. CAU 1775]